MLFQRILQQTIETALFKGKVIIVYGARRTGKTTLVRQILKKYPENAEYINCELQEYQEALNTTNSVLLKDFIGKNRLIVLDEAQHIHNIGLILKVLVDTFPHVQFIATGSSSFDLSSKISEPLTGRLRQYLLLPLSVEELREHFSLIDLQAMLPNILRFGLYPQVFTAAGNEKIEELTDISNNYLYKDILQFENLKKPELISGLLKAIALQTGSEASYNELAQLTGTNVHTVRRYLELLEKNFIIFRLSSFSRNLRKEINKSQKFFFYDLGIRNALIRNYNEPEIRTDTGSLWENFCISERIKYNENHRNFANTYFWRTYDQKEIDYLEEGAGELKCFEFKYNPKTKSKIPAEFLTTYPGSSFSVITPNNFYELIGIS
ncbi:MAG: ATP-binding protein [Bacteroidetes bacterium]|nr:MAG: ATP-binding protein [Bacteroidota bacterium]